MSLMQEQQILGYIHVHAYVFFKRFFFPIIPIHMLYVESRIKYIDDKTSARRRYAIVLCDRVVTAATKVDAWWRSTH